jgi:hypothetical protein
VNWKLSAKRDRLMVRKPEAFAGGDQVLVLDAANYAGELAAADAGSGFADDWDRLLQGNRALPPDAQGKPASAEDYPKLRNEQTAIEAMLALASALTKREILCRIYVCFGESGGWQVASVQGGDEIERLRFALCEYEFTQSFTYGRLPVDDCARMESASGFTVFTARPDAQLYELLEPLRAKGILPEIASAVGGSANNWQIFCDNGEVVFRRG